MSVVNSDILSLFALVASASARGRRAAEVKLRARNLTFAQYGALQALAAQDGLSQAELAQALETDSTTAMVLRGSLEKKDLVKREADASDARIRRIVLTAQGKSLISKVTPEVATLFAPGKAAFSEADLKKFMALLEKLKDFAQGLIPAPAVPEGGKRKPGRPRKAEKKAASKKPAKKVAAKVTKKAPAKKAVKKAPARKSR